MGRDLHILIIGHPHGGTSVLYNMICAAWPELGHGPGEANAVEDMATPGDRVSKRPMDSVRSAEIVDKAEKYNKDLRVIWLTRDPRDVLTSYWGHGPDKYGKAEYVMDATHYRTSQNGWRSTLGYLPLYRGQKEWNASVGISYRVKYELLVDFSNVVETQIMGMLLSNGYRLRYETPFRNFHEFPDIPMRVGHRAQPVTDVFVGRWKRPEHAAYLKEHFANPEMRAAVRDLGYEENDDWYEGLT